MASYLGGTAEQNGIGYKRNKFNETDEYIEIQKSKETEKMGEGFPSLESTCILGEK